MIGKTVSHYHILEKLGEGGMGEVWKAQDTRLDRFVAIKFVPERTADDAQTVERFLREARAASALNHPHICTIFDIGEWEGRRFIVMELLEGLTLRDWVASGPLDLERILEIGTQLADALDAAHTRNIIHRDIKSTNIILSDRGRAAILDFGLAKIVMSQGPSNEDEATMVAQKDLTDAGLAVGTIGTMSPEQALGKDVDARTDIFSLGAVLYELATGRQAFPGNTSAAVFDAILNRDPVAPATLNPDLPPALVRIIEKMLEKDRDLRYRSAADVVTDLKRLRRDSGSQASVSVAAAQLRRKSGSSRRLLLGLAGVVVVAAAVTTVGMLRGRPEARLGPFQTRPLTGMVGVEGSGSWSPDGSFVAFNHCADGPMDIFVMSATGGDPMQLVKSPADDTYPRWSPDNRWIAFASGRDGPAAIYLVPPLGGSVRKLVDLESPALNLDGLIGANPWSPDGRFLVYSRAGAADGPAVFKIDVENGSETQLTDPDNNEAHLSPSWSVDGRRIAFVRYAAAGGATLMTMDPGGRELTEEYADEKALNAPAWTPDSRSLVFDSDRGGSNDLWVLKLGSESPQPLTSGGGDEEDAAVSRSGNVLYNTTSHQTDLYLRDLGTGEERRLTSHTQDNFGAQFSPDGKRIAYMSSRTGDGEIWVLDLETGDELRPAPHPKEDRSPTWSRDGKEILFISSRAGTPQAWAVAATGGAPRKLSDDVILGSLRITPDGAQLGFIGLGEGRTALKTMPVAGGPSTELLAGVTDFGWYGDSRRAIVTLETSTGNNEMRAVDLDTGEQVLLLSEPQIELAVAADGSGVSYCASRSHFNMNLHILPLEKPATAGGLPHPAGPPRKITHGDGEWHVHNGGWSPDTRSVVYTRDTDTGDLYIMQGVFPPAS